MLKISMLEKTCTKYEKGSNTFYLCCFQIVNDMNDLIEWFDDEAKKIKSAEDVSSDPVKLNKQIAEQKVCRKIIIQIRRKVIVEICYHICTFSHS